MKIDIEKIKLLELMCMLMILSQFKQKRTISEYDKLSIKNALN